MSEEELVGSLGVKYKAAKERLAKKSAEATEIAEILRSTSEALSKGEMMDTRTYHAYKQNAPSAESLTALIKEITEARKQMEHARAQLATLGLKID
jgi:uncharacterized protein YPO0396